jgi:hypothetical protein
VEVRCLAASPAAARARSAPKWDHRVGAAMWADLGARHARPTRQGDFESGAGDPRGRNLVRLTPYAEFEPAQLVG